MCGIHGILSLQRGEQLNASLLKAMATSTVHRGPDDEGEYSEAHIAFGMRRLSIIDLAGGRQPIANEDGTIWVVCNGEIYNFRELRRELTGLGHHFKTASDTEVLVHMYEEYGLDFVKNLGGMFGFALWDSRLGRLILGRDRLGIKPLYYLNDGKRLVFSSEAKAILTLPDVKTELNPAGLCQYLALGYTPAPFSMFLGISKLPVASVMICEQGRVNIQRYWRPPTQTEDSLSEDSWKRALLEKLESSVVSQMVSDVPLGAFLSGGIDSSTVVAFMSKNSPRPVKTYAIGFDDVGAGSYYNELDYARQVASLFKTDHKEILVRPDVSRLLPKLVWHMDEPIADSAFITTYLVAEFARREVTVILSGVGGDEVFGGYRRYLGEHYSRYCRVMPRWFLRGVVGPLAERLPSDRHSPLLNLSRHVRTFLRSCDLPFEQRYRTYVEVFKSQKIGELLTESTSSSFDALEDAFGETDGNHGDPVNRLLTVDMLTQLPDDLLLLTDKMTMATSLECRVPLLDHELVELCLRMPSRLKIRGGNLKFILKKALEGVLPRSILYRKKRGFGAPFGAWLKRDLSGLVKHLLSRESIERRGVFSWKTISETISDHEASKEDHTDHLLSLINFELWSRMYLENQTPEELTEELAACANC